MGEIEPVDYIAVGHICLDLLPEGTTNAGQPQWNGRAVTIGGTVVYSALTARNLGLSAAIVSPLPRIIREGFAQTLEGIAQSGTQAGDAVTVFENIYTGHGREQYLRSVGLPIKADDVPDGWQETPAIVHLGPLAQEFDHTLAAIFHKARLVGVTPQGWLRQWDATQKVQPTLWPIAEARAVLRHADVLVLSDEDIGGDTARLLAYRDLVRIVVLTHGVEGCTVFDQRAEHPFRVPAFPTAEIEPTGAGDVFATAFFVRLAETDDPLSAAQFANAAASFAVEASGVAGIPPSRAAVEARTAVIAEL